MVGVDQVPPLQFQRGELGRVAVKDVGQDYRRLARTRRHPLRVTSLRLLCRPGVALGLDQLVPCQLGRGPRARLRIGNAGRLGERDGDVLARSPGHGRVQPLRGLPAGGHRDADGNGTALDGVSRPRVSLVRSAVPPVPERVLSPCPAPVAVSAERCPDGQPAIVVDRFHPQSVPVGDTQLVIGLASQDDVPPAGPRALGQPHLAAALDQAQVHQVVPDSPADLTADLPLPDHQLNVGALQVVADVQSAGIFDRCLGRAATDPPVIVVLGNDRAGVCPQSQRGVPLRCSSNLTASASCTLPIRLTRRFIPPPDSTAVS